MGKGKKGNGKKKKFPFIIVAIVLLIATFALGLASRLTNNFTTGVQQFALVYNNKYLLGNQTGFRFDESGTIEIKQFDENNLQKIDVKVYAVQNTKGEVVFEYGGTELNWNDAIAEKDGREVSGVLDVSVQQSAKGKNGSVTVSGNVNDVVAYFAGGEDVEYVTFTDKGEFFLMVITVGTQSVTLTFSTLPDAVKLELNQEGLVF